MHKIIFILLAIVISPSIVFAQSTTSTSIIGKLIDNKGEAIVNVSVTVTKKGDSVLLKGAITSSTGNFSLHLFTGSYKLTFSYSGYKVVEKNINVVINTVQMDLGKIILEEKTKELSAVTITAQKPLIEHKIDRSVLNVENSILAAGNTALELLEQAPYVSVDQNGNISIRGNQGALVMIDGRQTFLSNTDLVSFLRNIPSSQIAKIEVITNPSSKYDAAGSAGIINIKMKKNVNDGLNGVVNMSLQQGRMPRWMEGINLNYRRKKINLYSSINYTRNERWNEETTTTTFNSDGNPYNKFSITENSFYYSHSANMRAGLDYTLSPKTTAGFLLNYFAGRENENSKNTNRISNLVLQKDSSLFTQHTGISRYNNYSFNFNISHQFDTTGKNISIDVDRAKFNDESLPWYYSDFFNSNGFKIFSQVFNGNMKTEITILSAKTDYEQPLKKGGMFSAGIKTSNVKTDNSIRYYLDGQIDRGRTNDFVYSETINAVYADFSKEFKKLSIKLGLRGEQTISKGKQVTTDSVFTRNYFQLFPTGYLQYRWNDKHRSGITFNKRIGRPDYESLNPFVYFSDPYTSWGGNPYLQPALTYSVNISHIYKNMFTIFAGTSRTNNIVSQFQKTDSITNGIFSTNENLGTATNFSIGISANLKPVKWWRFNANTIVFQNNSKGKLGNTVANASITSYRVFINNNFILSKKMNAEMGFWYRPASLWGLSKTGPLGSLSIGIQRKLFKDNGVLKLNINDIFKMQKMKTTSTFGNISSESLAISENRTIRISFSYSFGNKKVKTERERNNGVEDESGRVKGRD
jgi:iron complex outermembrane recepter protein